MAEMLSQLESQHAGKESLLRSPPDDFLLGELFLKYELSLLLSR